MCPPRPCPPSVSFVRCLPPRTAPAWVTCGWRCSCFGGLRMRTGPAACAPWGTSRTGGRSTTGEEEGGAVCLSVAAVCCCLFRKTQDEPELLLWFCFWFSSTSDFLFPVPVQKKVLVRSAFFFFFFRFEFLFAVLWCASELCKILFVFLFTHTYSNFYIFFSILARSLTQKSYSTRILPGPSRTCLLACFV